MANTSHAVVRRLSVLHPANFERLFSAYSRTVSLSPAVCIRCFSRGSRAIGLAPTASPYQPFAPLPRSGRPQNVTIARRRAYHSSDHPPPPGPFSAAERDILTAAYARVPSHGFTSDAVTIGARDAGYLDISASVLPDGVFGLVRWHLVTQRERLALRACELFGEQGSGSREGLSVGDKVEALTWERLMANRMVVGRWQEALAIMAQPSHVSDSLKELAALVDEICYLAGDISVDPSWYTKRALLSAIYASTELFMTTDRSPDFQETRAFLKRRLGEAKDIGGSVRSIGHWVGFTANAGLNVLRSKGVRI